MQKKTEKKKVLVKKNSRPLGRQAIFNRAKKHLLSQKTRCAKGPGRNALCLYRSLDGRKACAIGAIIPDSMYRRDLESTGLYTICEWMQDSGIIRQDVDYCFCFRLQQLHDRMGFNYMTLEESLVGFAKEYNLKYDYKN